MVFVQMWNSVEEVSELQGDKKSGVLLGSEAPAYTASSHCTLSLAGSGLAAADRSP